LLVIRQNHGGLCITQAKQWRDVILYSTYLNYYALDILRKYKWSSTNNSTGHWRSGSSTEKYKYLIQVQVQLLCPKPSLKWLNECPETENEAGSYCTYYQLSWVHLLGPGQDDH